MKKTNDVQPGPGSASERSESLLDLIAREAHCDYLSDLHSLYLKGQLPEEISQITKDSFGVQQWNEAVSYITRRSLSFTNVQEAQQYLFVKNHTNGDFGS
ncbi:hypothetical protein [Diplocloster modestus]|uniref:Uncharacterized protein n=1 Tax=Diplocloster modestus TaxID=2850322 RepID=A0ABS6KDA2_9FIRM|nr:hypothetical protein [Diplocloster modestus]MBU9728489.1 hypothetical protein [Diplocloster modestus]